MKVGHKARRGRKKHPVPHKSHRGPRAVKDPISKAMRRERRRKMRRSVERAERAAW